MKKKMSPKNKKATANQDQVINNCHTYDDSKSPSLKLSQFDVQKHAVTPLIMAVYAFQCRKVSIGSNVTAIGKILNKSKILYKELKRRKEIESVTGKLCRKHKVKLNKLSLQYRIRSSVQFT